jgi:hypothetical protein
MVEREPHFYEAAQPSQRKTYKSTRLVGLEIEVAKVSENTESLVQACRTWRASIVEDGSVDDGFEINTSPAAGDYLPAMIARIGRGLREADARVDQRCGLHVHVDCRDFSFYDMRKLVKLYTKIEPALFAMMPGSRRRSVYCRPCGQRFVYDLDHFKIPKDSKRKLLQNVTDSTPDVSWKTQRSSKGGRYGSRYNAMNLLSWLYRGTIECRLHTGTVQASKMHCWALLWQAIVDFAYKNTEHEINTLYDSGDLGSAEPLLLKIAPSDEVRAYVTSRINEFRNHGPLLPGESD